MAFCQPAAASESHEAHPATPYQQVVHPPWQVRFASPITKAETVESECGGEGKAMKQRAGRSPGAGLSSQDKEVEGYY